MAGGLLMFYATKEDLIPVLSYIESIFEIKYIKIGLFDNKEPSIYYAHSEIPNFGFVINSHYQSYESRFMIMERKDSIFVRDIPQRKGGIKYAIDPMKNPQSIEFTLGGICQEIDNVLIMGRTGYVDKNSFSESIYKELTKKMKKDFRKYNSMEYVGPEAEVKLKEGWRLVQDTGRSKEYDLKLK
jgi:hypothetical protein